MVQTFSTQEIKELTIATIGLGTAFAIFFYGSPDPFAFLLSTQFPIAWAAATLLVAVSFIPHEMAHRATARVFEAYAEFRMWPTGILIAIFTSFLGIIFAAPGGVEIFTKRGERWGRHETELTPKHIGVIAMVGPLMNISLALIFASLTTVLTFTLAGTDLLTLGSRLNALLALFNLIPVYPLDGYKTLRWSPRTWGVATLLALSTFFII